MLRDGELVAVGGTRVVLGRQPPGLLVINDLTVDDLLFIGWSGGLSHVQAVERALLRALDGEVEYLAVRAPNGWPVCIGGVDFAVRDDDSGVIWQLVTHEKLRSLGLGTRLIREAENRIRRRGLRWSKLGVEDSNSRARSLYGRLGYQDYGHTEAEWEQADSQGTTVKYNAQITLMQRRVAR